MRILLTFFVLLVYLFLPLDAGELVPQAERNLQRNLYTLLSLGTRAQMMMKDYTLTVQGVLYANPSANLDDEIEEQNDDFEMLDLTKIDPSLKKDEAKLQKQWETLSQSLSKQIKSSKTAVELLQQVDAFDRNVQGLAERLAKRSIHPALKYAFDLQRLDQLAQRISTLYEMRILQVLDENRTHQSIANMLDRMTTINARLRQAPSPLFSQKLKNELDATKRSFSLYKIMALSRSRHYIPALISQKSNEMDMLLRNIVEEHQVVVQHMPDTLPGKLASRP